MQRWREWIFVLLLISILTVVYHYTAQALPDGSSAIAPVTYKRINGPLPEFGSVGGYKISPDEQWVIYLAKESLSDNRDLYRVPIMGGADPIWLNEQLPQPTDVGDFEISADGSYVVFLATLPGESGKQLFSVPIGGGEVARLNGPLSAGGAVHSFRITSDGRQVVYAAEEEQTGVVDLYIVPTSGGGIRLTNLAVTSDTASIVNYALSPDDSLVIYQARQVGTETDELFSVLLNGGPVVKLNGPLPAGGTVWDFIIGPDSSRVVFRAEQDVNDRIELYSVPSTGGAVQKLNDPLVSGRDVDKAYEISSDNQYVVYLADAVVDEQNELFSCSFAGSSVVKLNDLLGSGGEVLNFLITPDSSKVVYTADKGVQSLSEVYVVPIGGGQSIKLSEPLPEWYDFGGAHADHISPDGNWVLYLQDTNSPSSPALVVASLDGNGPVKGVGAVPENGWWRHYSFTKDSNQVIYIAQGYHTPLDLNIFDMNSDERTLISQDFGVFSSSGVTSFSFANNTNYIVFKVFTSCPSGSYSHCELGTNEIYTSYYLNARHLFLPNVPR